MQHQLQHSLRIAGVQTNFCGFKGGVEVLCKFCHTKLNDKAVFCKNCGARVQRKKKHSFKQECKMSILPFIFSLLYLVWSIWYLFAYSSSLRYGGDAYISFINRYLIINFLARSLFWGGLAYVTTKRSFKITLLFLVPYLLYNISYPVLNGRYFAGYGYEEYVEYFGGILIPFIVIAFLKLSELLLDRVRNRVMKEIVFTVVTIIVFETYLVISWLFYNLSHLPKEQAVGYYIWNLILTYLPYAIGVWISYLLLHMVYGFGIRERDKNRKNKEQDYK